MTDDRQSLVAELHEQLEATAERPVEREASRWLGEAEAVAADAVHAPPDATALRLEQVEHLLSEVDETGDSKADEHVRRARELLERLGGR